MSLATRSLTVVDTVDTRVLGAFQFVDATTRLPVSIPGGVEVRSARIVELQPGASAVDIQPVPLGPGAITIRQNRLGRFVLFRAPLFFRYTGVGEPASYVDTFDTPVLPPELLNPARRLRLEIGVVDAGPRHLPRRFDFDLPRSLNPDAASSVFDIEPIHLFRAPAAPAQEGWSLLRIRATQTGSGDRLPGVLVRVFRRPRQAADEPIGEGLTQWGDPRLAGEALVAVPGLARFTPGAGANVFDTTHAVELEATRDTAFTGAPGQLPDPDLLRSGVGATLVRRPAPPDLLTVTRPADPLALGAGRELVVELQLP